jgi:uncharacterized protein (DUF1015 family)
MSPVFGLYNDPEGLVRALVSPPEDAVLAFEDVQGVAHRFWPICAADAIAEIQAALASHEVVIADGHHRYETALAYREERRREEGDPAESRPYDHVLMYLADAQDPGLAILATHRVIGCWREVDRGRLLARLAHDFDIARVDGDLSLSQAIVPAAPDEVILGAYLGPAGSWALRLKDRRVRRGKGSAGQADSAGPDLADLDVVVLQELILGPLLDISADMLTHSDCVDYATDEFEARARVDEGTAQAAFILNPTTVEQIWRAATAGLTMPQKSTYFYPKLLTGLVTNLLD